MSGYVAVLSRRGGDVDAGLLARLASPLAPHGPHAAGEHREDGVGLAHALLRARENASCGPHRSPRGAWLVGDVRIDAQAALRDALAAAGEAVPRASPDESLVLAAWHVWGEDAAARLLGDFSFAIWDPARRVLFCARDAFGVRPLYYADAGDTFVCSNVLGAVRAHPAVSARLHEPAIVSFLCVGWNVDLTTTSFADVRRLAPAHQLVVPADAHAAATPRRYWSFPVPAPLRLRRDEDYVERFRATLGEAVRDRLRVPRAAILLSGGLHSPSLAATARRVAPEAELVAYTTVVSPMVPDGDTPLASLVARRLGVRHEIVDDVPLPLEHLGDRAFRPEEPLDEPEQSAWLRLARRIAAESPVLFVGEDGDALFQPPGLMTMLRTWPVLDVLSRVVRYTISHGHHPHLGLWLRRRLRALGRPREDPLPPWVRRDVVARTGVPLPAPIPRHPTRPESQQFLLGTVVQSIFEGFEPAYTRAALEARWPFLDLRVLEFALAIPPVPWCQRKELMRRAFRGELPDEVLRRPKTTLTGYDDAQVAMWRAAQDWRPLELAPRTNEFVDSAGLLDYLRVGSTSQVLAAWRVLALDRWLRAL